MNELLENKLAKPNKLPCLSVLFPAHNEGKNIPKLLESAFRIIPEITQIFEIIIVDDGSTDNTFEILEKYKLYESRLIVVHHDKNKGYGAAICSGLKACRYDFIFFSDSDNQFDLSEIKLLIEHIDKYDAVLGYRKKRVDPLFRKLNAFGWKIVTRLFLGIMVKDTNCAFKLFSRKCIDGVQLISDGAMISAELLAYFKLKKARIKEIPVSHYPRKEGTPTGAKLKVILKAFNELFKIRNEISKLKSK
jgi:glycosyltransferase involved in cell wall biosynthesis